MNVVTYGLSTAGITRCSRLLGTVRQILTNDPLFLPTRAVVILLPLDTGDPYTQLTPLITGGNGHFPYGFSVVPDVHV